MIHGFKGHCPAVGRPGIVVRSLLYFGAFGGFGGLAFAKLRAAFDFRLGFVLDHAIIDERLIAPPRGRVSLKVSTSAARSAELTAVVVVLGLRMVRAALDVVCFTRAGFLDAAIG